jgi:PqqD family protein of HPr-rel-A system
LLSFSGIDLSNQEAQPAVTWRITPGQALRHREWNGEVVLYNDLSGDTHLLDESALYLLHTLQGGSASGRALADSMRSAFEADDGEVDDASVVQILAKLAALALIETAA